jgi:EmrB/QacA subfamily drug resistance transporter
MAESSSRAKMTPAELLIVLVISLGSFMAGLDATIVNIALPTIAKAFSITTVTSSWVLNAYLIVLVSLLLVSARLGDMKGYRKVFLTGFTVFTIGSVLCGLSPSIDFLILARVLQAVGGAIISALGAVMVTTYLSAALRGQALGIVAMFTMLGAALGPVIGGFLTSAFSWQFIFFVNVPVGIVAILLGLRVLPHAAPATPNSDLDLPGVVLITIALSTLIFGLTTIAGSARSAGIVALVIAVIFWPLFLLREKSAKMPLVNLNLFKNRSFTFQNFDVMIIQMGMAGVMILMPFYLELVKHLPTDNAGTVLLALPIGMILTSPIAGRISDVIGTKKPIIGGFIIAVLGLLLLSTLSSHSNVGHSAIYLFILGAGTGIAYAPLNSAIMGQSPPNDRGAASGLIKMMTNLGSSLGVALVMLVTTMALGPKLAEVSAHTIPMEDLAIAFDTAFLFLMVLEIVGIVLMLPVKETETDFSSEEAPVAAI